MKVLKLFPVAWGYGWHGWKWIETWKKLTILFKFWCYVFKKFSRHLLWLPISSFVIFVVALQKHSVYDLSLKVKILAQSWPKTAKSSWQCPFKVPISSKFLFSYLILYIIQWTSAKEKFDLDKMQSSLEVLKTFKFAATIRTSLPFVLNKLWHRLKSTWLEAWLISLVLPL